MPGMMDAILNLGLNDKTVIALAKHLMGCQGIRRFIQMYGCYMQKYRFERLMKIIN